MKRSRREQGSLLAIVAVVLLVLLAIVLAGGQTIWSFVLHKRYEQAIEAAALKGASDLSDIVINDPYFGFISLSDRPAIGHGTIAEDGQPLPVHGINTIIAASRLDYLVATELGDDRLVEFALDDVEHARTAALNLKKVLAKAVQGECKDATDMDGNIVRPYADALQAYSASLEYITRDPPQDFKLILGRLTPFGETVTPVPYSSNSRLFSPKEVANGYYRAYVDLPVGGQHLSFASLGLQPSLVSVNKFAPADNEHICTIVKAQATCQLYNLLPWEHESQKMAIQACGQPYTLNTLPAPSVLILSFPDGCPNGIDSMLDLMSDFSLGNLKMGTFTPVGNDYPLDRNCTLEPLDIHLSASSAFALLFHDWLRSNYALPKLDAVIAAANQSFAQSMNGGRPILAVEASRDGNIVMSQLRQNPFPNVAVQEKQLYSRSVDPLALGVHYWTATCRSEVHTQGTILGGKHAGQPFPADPINWDELSTYVSEPFAHAAASRRPGGIVLNGTPYPGGGISAKDAQLLCGNGREPNRSLRKSSYSAGLACEFVLLTARAPLR
jgi:hypothetical protein